MAVTVLPIRNSSTYACFPEHPVSAQVSSPSLHPFLNSSLLSSGCLKLLKVLLIFNLLIVFTAKNLDDRLCVPFGGCELIM